MSFCRYHGFVRTLSLLGFLIVVSGCSLYYQSRYNLILRQVELLKFKQQLIEAWIALEIASGRYLLESHLS